MEKKKIVLWTSFQAYEEFRPQLVIEEQKGNIEIAAVMFLDEGVVKQVDGYEVIQIERLPQTSFDYVLGFGDELADDMIKILKTIGIERAKFLSARILKLPNFDFGLYWQVREAKVSIIADNCWGGISYHSLDLPFCSPFINLFVKKGDFARLVCNLKEYMELPLEYVGEDVDGNKGNRYPVCRLGDVEIHCNHYANFEEARAIWNARKARMNWDNLFVKMLIETEADLEEFLKIPYRKIGFSKIASQEKDIIDCSDIVTSGYLQEQYQGRFWEYVNWQSRVDRVDLKQYEVMKLLLGREDFRRVK